MPKHTLVLLVNNLESLDTARSGLNRPPWSGMHHAGETTLAFLSCVSQSVYVGECYGGTRPHLGRVANHVIDAYSICRSWAGGGASYGGSVCSAGFATRGEFIVYLWTGYSNYGGYVYGPGSGGEFIGNYAWVYFPFPLFLALEMFLFPAFGPFQRGVAGNGHRPRGCAMEWQMEHGDTATAAPQPSRPVG